jgi:hypothetical protein
VHVYDAGGDLCLSVPLKASPVSCAHLPPLRLGGLSNDEKVRYDRVRLRMELIANMTIVLDLLIRCGCLCTALCGFRLCAGAWPMAWLPADDIDYKHDNNA